MNLRDWEFWDLGLGNFRDLMNLRIDALDHKIIKHQKYLKDLRVKK